MKKIILLCLIILILICSSQGVFGAWQGPIDVIVGEWGSGDAQFGFKSGDIQDGFPYHFDISTEGMVLIADLINGRIKLYNASGALLKIFVPPVENPRIWIIKPAFLGAKIILPINKLYFFSFDGKIDKVSDYPKSLERINNWQVIDNKLYLEQTKPYICALISLDGQLLKTYPERPLELGRVEERSLGGGQYKVTVRYPDKEWVIIGKGACGEYMRIGDCELYCLGHRQIVRYDAVGNEKSRLTMPENRIKEIPTPGEGVEPMINVLEEYGSPVVSPLGDIYTWKRTPEKYSIIKWVWVDGPDAPQSLKVSSSKTGLSLNWDQPQKDPDTVTAYEINRSSTVCGPFRPIATVKKGVLTYQDQVVRPGETYYYQVRAIRDKTPSGYSNKAISTR